VAIVLAANSPDAGSEVAAVAGFAQVGQAPPQQSSPAQATNGGATARVALQAETADNNSGLLSLAADADTPSLRSPKQARAPWRWALEQFHALADHDSGESLRHSCADLIADLIPFDRAALERSIDRFIDQLDDDDGRQLGERWPARMLLFSTALAGGMLALDVLRRLRQRSAARGLRVRTRQARGDVLGFPELPGSWSSRLT